MAGYLATLKKEMLMHFNVIKDDYLRSKDANYFRPSGTQVYVGRQGSGKTISAVRHVALLKERYPRVILVSNLFLTGYSRITVKTPDQVRQAIAHTNFDPTKHYFYFQDFEQLSIALTCIDNDTLGVVYLIDEIHTYLNALDSKNIPMYIFTEISQQRKQRKVIVATSQLFDRIAKPLREQCDNMIVCRTSFSIFTTQKAYDAMTLDKDYDGSYMGKVQKRGWFFHSRKLRESYDTFQKVVSGRDQYEMQNSSDLNLNINGKKVKVGKK